MPNAVLDSTILVSAFLTKMGVSAELLYQAVGGAFQLSLAEEIIGETQRVLLEYQRIRKRYRYSDREVRAFCQALRKVFPLFSLEEAKTHAQKIFSEFYRNKENQKDKALEKYIYTLPSSPILSFFSFYHLLVAAILTTETFPLTYSIYSKLDACLEKLKLSPPPPLLFADTNWGQFYFGFVVNPGTLELELWRLDRRGCNGMPMSSWKEYVDGTSQKPWGILTNPKEYHGDYLHDFTLLTKKV